MRLPSSNEYAQVHICRDGYGCESNSYFTLVPAGFQKAVWGFGAIILVAAPLFAVTDFIGDRLKLEWRRWLTKSILSAYYANRSFYKIHGCDETSLDNPDQARAASMYLTYPCSS